MDRVRGRGFCPFGLAGLPCPTIFGGPIICFAGPCAQPGQLVIFGVVIPVVEPIGLPVGRQSLQQRIFGNIIAAIPAPPGLVGQILSSAQAPGVLCIAGPCNVPGSVSGPVTLHQVLVDAGAIPADIGVLHATDTGDLVLAGAEIAGSFVPGVGEALDLLVLLDENAAWWEKGLAAASLGLNAATGGVLPNAGFIRAGKALARGAKIAGKINWHHTVPREILRLLPEHVANNPLVRSRAGAPNRWPIPVDLHKQIHRDPGGGAYNEAFKRRLVALRREPTVDDVLTIRDDLVKQFGLEDYRP